MGATPVIDSAAIYARMSQISWRTTVARQSTEDTCGPTIDVRRMSAN
jgi:hypothetical protein